MPGNYDFSESDLSNKHIRHKRNIKIGAIFTFALLALSGLLVVVAGPRRRAGLIEDGAFHIDQMRRGFDSGNFTVEFRFDQGDEKKCGELDRTVHRALANGETKSTVFPLCSGTMWAKMNGCLSDETPCEVNVAPGTDEDQIAELNALDSICKVLARTADSATGYGVTLCLAALSLSYTLYHGFQGWDEKQSEREQLLEQKRKKGDLENPENSGFLRYTAA